MFPLLRFMFSRRFFFSSTLRRSTKFQWPTLARRTLLLSAVPAGYMIFDNAESLPSPATPQKQPLKALARAYLVYSLCAIPPLVDHAPSLLDTLSQIPLIRTLVYAMVKVTFFEHFVGGETASATIPLLRSLRAANKGVLFAYSAEVDEREALGLSHSTAPGDLSKRPGHDPPHKRVVKEILACIDVAAEFENSLRGASKALSFSLRNSPYLSSTAISDAATDAASSLEGRRTWVAVKITALLPDAFALVSLSKYITARREEINSGSGPRRYSTAVPSIVPKIEDVPFPGAAAPSDLDIVLSSSISSDALTPTEINALRDLYEDLVGICRRGQEKGVRIIVDAEYSWYQPAIDALTIALMRQFNTTPKNDSQNPAAMKPLVYGTYQAYLRRTPSHIAYHLADAKRHNYALGVKLVRGAYHGYEIAAHEKKGPRFISPESMPPVWSEKRESDESYNSCARRLIWEVKEDLQKEKSGVSAGQGVAVLFGTHNRDSCELVVDELVDLGLGEIVAGGSQVRVGSEVAERVTIAQLYGMCDDLTDGLAARLVSDSPMVIKYLPYGGIKEVMPYLSRRAVENKSVLGNGAAARERDRAFKEIMNRLKEMASFKF